MPFIQCLQDVRVVSPDAEIDRLCDDNGIFYRVLFIDEDSTIQILDFDYNGDPYVPVGTPVDCGQGGVFPPPFSNFIPNPDGNDQVLQVLSSSQSFAGLGGTLHINTTHVQIRFEIASTRMTVNGSPAVAGINPSGLGTEWKSNDIMIFPVEAIQNAFFIRNTSVSGYIQVSEWIKS